MKNYKRISAFLLSLVMIFGVISINVSAVESAKKLEFIGEDGDARTPSIELNTEYTLTLSEGASGDEATDDEACYAYISFQDVSDYQFILTGKNISVPTEDGLAKIEILNRDKEKVCGIGMAEGNESRVAYKLNSYTHYYLKFYSEDTSGIGGELSFTLSTADDPETDNFNRTRDLSDKKPYEGSIVIPEDVDVFSFTKYSQEDFKCVVEPEEGFETPFAAELYIYDYDTEEAQLVASATSDETLTIIYRNASPDEYVPYRLKIFSLGSAFNYTARFNNVRTYADMELESYISKKLGAYGEDDGTNHVRFTTAERDAYYDILVHNTGIKTGATEDEYLQAELLDENFELVDKVSVACDNSDRIIAKLAPNKVYYLKIYNGNTQDTEGGSYAVQLMYDYDEDRGIKEYAFETELGKINSGFVETSYDEDWYKIKTGDSTRYILMLENKSEEVIIEHDNGTWEVKSIRAEIIDENGEKIETALASGEDFAIRRVDLEPNTTYYIKVYDPVFTIAEYDVALFERLILGDTNLDDSVKIQDATLIQKYAAKIVGLEGKQLLTADVTKDGKVNVKDATAIQKYIAKVKTPYDVGSYIY